MLYPVDIENLLRKRYMSALEASVATGELTTKIYPSLSFLFKDNFNIYRQVFLIERDKQHFSWVLVAFYDRVTDTPTATEVVLLQLIGLQLAEKFKLNSEERIRAAALAFQNVANDLYRMANKLS